MGDASLLATKYGGNKVAAAKQMHSPATSEGRQAPPPASVLLWERGSPEGLPLGTAFSSSSFLQKLSETCPDSCLNQVGNLDQQPSLEAPGGLPSPFATPQ